ncbi:MAG: polysaccharide deacetylase family protein [Elusimicrobia bacterium]|nr:polysaccharide deacetylase family protein [Elusimicrobiota bacterium]
MSVLAVCAAAGAAAALAASARWNWWRPRVAGVPVLMYHKFGDPAPGTRFKAIWSTGAAFRRQLEHLKRRGYAPMTFAELRDAEQGKIPMPARPVLITIDDGYANNYEVAYPLLKEFGMKANIFLVCEAMGGDSRFDAPFETAPPLPMLTWDQIREMQDSGVVEFGSHTLRHRNLAEIPLAQVREEVSGSKKLLEAKLGREVLGFAYPRGEGASEPEVRRCVFDAGYRYDFSTVKGITPSPWDRESGALKRVEPVNGVSLLDFHLLLTRGRTRINRRFWE